jgi:RNA polymerase sigma-70 factor (ECF subfamily)
MNDRHGNDAREERFRPLYQKYYLRVVRFFVRAFRFSQEDAEELAQEAFLRFYDSMADYRGDAEWSFFETIARNVALNRIRANKTQKRNRKTVDIDDPQAMSADPPAPPEPDYAERQEAESRRKRLYSAIDELPPRQRQCILPWLDDLTYDQISTALRISMDAVKSSIRDAKRVLAAKLGEDARLPEGEP